MEEKCEGIKGGNVCGRKADFVIDYTFGYDVTVSYACVDCVGRIMVEKDFDAAKVERLYD